MNVPLEWQDPRLNYRNDSISKFVPFDKSFTSLLWLPDIAIYPINNIRRNSFFGEFEEISYKPNYTIVYNTLIKVKIYCNMSFEEYPKGECDV